MTGSDYVESSAIAKLVLSQAEEGDLRDHLAGTPGLVTSLLSFAEVHRAVHRARPGDWHRIAEAFEHFVMIEVARDVIDAAARLQPPTLRTLDAIHVASAMQLGAELRSFVTYDRRLAEAARGAGLPVVSPGA